MNSRTQPVVTAPWWGALHPNRRPGGAASVTAEASPFRLSRGPGADLVAALAPLVGWALLWSLFLAALV